MMSDRIPVIECNDYGLQLISAAQDGRVEDLKRLFNENPFAFKCFVNETAPPLGATPLRLAASGGWCACAKYLLLHGAEIDKVDRKGQTPLFCAVTNYNYDVVILLLSHGACPNGSSLNRLTPLQAMFSQPDPFMSLYGAFLMLLKAGADVDVEDEDCAQRCILCSFAFTECPVQYLVAYYQFGGRHRKCVCNVRKDVIYPRECADEIAAIMCNPLTLKSLCRITIRKILGFRRLPLIKQLPLPPALLSFLMYREFPF